MSQRNDCILSVGGSQLNDQLLSHYKANGATSNTLSDAEREFLLAKGAVPSTIPDMWLSYLTALGYSGSISDMVADFWCVGGGT